MIINDNQIHYLCTELDPPMISPYTYAQCRKMTVIDNPLKLTGRTIPVVSYGQSSFGYDIRLADTGIQLLVDRIQDFPYTARVIDPKAFDTLKTLLHQSVKRDDTGIFYTLPPHAYALGVSIETFDLPRNILGICYCKSTYARCGMMVNTTPLEPGWRGQLVIELANLTDLPVKVYANEGIAQVVFFEGEYPQTSYADRDGKYQNQKGIVTARI